VETSCIHLQQPNKHIVEGDGNAGIADWYGVRPRAPNWVPLSQTNQTIGCLSWERSSLRELKKRYQQSCTSGLIDRPTYKPADVRVACAKPKRLPASRPRSTAATCLAAVLWHPEVCRCAYVAPDHEVNQTCLCTCVCIDCCCFYYFIRNSKVALLEALSDRVCVCNCAYMYMRVRIYTYIYICTYMCV
jgi:hypothetical protein